MPNLKGDEAHQYLKRRGLQQSLGEAIRAARYSINWVKQAPIPNEGGAFQAHNPQQGYSAYFANDQVHLVSRSADENWRVAMKLTAYGYSTEQSVLGSAQWSVAEKRIERVLTSVSGVSSRESRVPVTTDPRLATANSGPIVEWYENRPEGLEQGFTIKAPPDSQLHSPDARLRLKLQLEGDLRARLMEGGQALSFVKGEQGATVLHYGKLKSTDANGKELASRMELQDNELSLLVDDHESVYPLTIDPLFTQAKKITAFDASEGAFFGDAVAISGDTIVVGAAVGFSPAQGSAYIFERNQGGAENWALVKELTAPDGLIPDLFGWSVAISGDTVIVGAFQHKVGDYWEQGSVYIYDRNLGGANNWGLVKELTSSDGTVNDHFGYSVTTNGDTAIVGMINYNHIDNHITRSAVYIYGRDQGGANNWGEVRIIRMTDGQNDSEGYAVAMSGDTAVIGAPQHFNPGPPSIGAAFIIERDAGGPNNWGIVRTLNTGQPLTFDRFGVAVAIEGDKVLVGAGEYISSEENVDNAAYLFERNTGGPDNWGLVKKIVATDDASGNAFALSLSISNDTAVVGALGAQIGANVQRGAVYVFKQNAGGANNWGQVKKIVAADGASGDLFGWSVALEGKTLVAGAPSDDGAILDQGSAYVFKSVNDSWIEDAKSLPAGCTVDDGFAFSVSISGDTTVVGTYAADVGTNANQGVVYIFERNQGGSDNWGLVKTLTASDGAVNDRFGFSVAISNDTVLVGALLVDVGAHSNQGAAYLFQRNAGGANNWGEVKKLTAADGVANSLFGGSLDISNDTVVIGVSTSHGAAYVFERNAGGSNNWSQIKKLQASDGASGDNFGDTVGIDGDTIAVAAIGDDVEVNAEDDVEVHADQGSAYVFERNNGGSNNWGEVRKLLAPDGAANDHLGRVDISGDNVILGGIANVGGNIAQGYAYIFGRHTGGANNWGPVKKIVASDGGPFDYFCVVAISGDTAIVGAGLDSIGGNQGQGSAYIFKQNAGGGNNWGEVKKLSASDGTKYDAFGSAVAISGDTAIVGACGDDVQGAVDLGSAYVFVNQNGTWTQQTQLNPPLPANCGTSDAYGWSVAISGDTVVIGAWADDVGVNKDQGSVYILERNQGGANHWGVVKLLLASDGASYVAGDGFTYGDGFGFSVSISGDTVVVGSFQATVGTNAVQGAAYIFERNEGGPANWGQARKLTASDGAAFTNFGGAVSIDNNTIVVGAYSDDVNGNNAQGSAYIFERNLGGTGNWREVKKLNAADGAALDIFGGSVSISGDTAIVGAYGHDGPNSNQGSAYIFERGASGQNNWGQVKKLTASDGESDDGFGFSVAISDNTLIVGAYGNDIGDNVDQGAAYIFGREAGGPNNWGELKRLVAADGATGDYFGFAAGIGGDTAIVGAFLDDVGDNNDQGSAYIFEQNKGGPDNWGQVQRLGASEGSAGDGFGRAVAVSGDDLIIGANVTQLPAQSTNKKISSGSPVANDQGLAYVFRGNASVPTAAPATISGRVTGANGTPLGGVLMTLTGGGSLQRRTMTNASGNYSFANVDTGNFYTVSPALANYLFSPGSRSFSLLGNNTDAIFTAIPGSVGANPLDTPEFFVRQQYLDFLDREPDQIGFEYWDDQINQCHGDATCVRQRRIDVSAAFFIEHEFQASGSYIYDLYTGTLGRQPAFAEYSSDRRQVVGGAHLDAEKAAFATNFVQRDDFVARYQAEATGEAFVDALLQNVQSAGVDLSSERTNLLTTYNIGAGPVESRAHVVREIADNAAFKQSQYNRAFVLMEYFGYLRRDPDPGGYNFWVNVLNSTDAENYRGMVCSFITSREYQLRFAPIATHANNECQ